MGTVNARARLTSGSDSTKAERCMSTCYPVFEAEVI